MQKTPDSKIITLKDELEDAKGKLRAEKNAHKHTKDKHNIFKDRLADLYGSVHSEEGILKFATGNTTAMDDRDKYKDLWEREVIAHKEDIVKHQKELEKLMTEIGEMRKEKKDKEIKVQADNEVFDKRMDTIETKINDSVEKKKKAEKAVVGKVIAVKPSLITRIRTLFKREKHG